MVKITDCPDITSAGYQVKLEIKQPKILLIFEPLVPWRVNFALVASDAGFGAGGQI